MPRTGPRRAFRSARSTSRVSSGSRPRESCIEAGAFTDVSATVMIVRAANEEDVMALARDDVYMRNGVWVEVRVRPFGRVRDGLGLARPNLDPEGSQIVVRADPMNGGEAFAGQHRVADRFGAGSVGVEPPIRGPLDRPCPHCARGRARAARPERSPPPPCHGSGPPEQGPTRARREVRGIDDRGSPGRQVGLGGAMERREGRAGHGLVGLAGADSRSERVRGQDGGGREEPCGQGRFPTPGRSDEHDERAVVARSGRPSASLPTAGLSPPDLVGRLVVDRRATDDMAIGQPERGPVPRAFDGSVPDRPARERAHRHGRIDRGRRGPRHRGEPAQPH